jgi:hypothetical protein
MARHLFHAFKRAISRPDDPLDPFQEANRLALRIGMAVAGGMAAALGFGLATLGPAARDLASFAATLLIIAACITWMPAPFAGLPS